MTKHWALQDAKARLSELVRAAEKEPQIITYRGKPKVEVRAVGKNSKGKPKTFLELMRSAPPVWPTSNFHLVKR
jgi:antitoxin (DNA-binding transcriptional repressor) of toxin-antitoxin stability system